MLLRLVQAAEWLGVSSSTLRRMIRAGQIPTIRLGWRRVLVRRAALEALVEKAERPAQPEAQR
jgi:excisionase family DNA binding protein